MKNSTLKIATCFLIVFGIFLTARSQDGQEFTAYDDITVEFPGELIDVVTPAIVAAPNPTSDAYLKVWYRQLEKSSRLTLSDLSGKQVHIARLGGENGKKEGMYQIPVMNLPKGIYVVNLTSGIYKSTKKILIQ